MRRMPVAKFIVVCVFTLFFTVFLFIYPSIDERSNTNLHSIIWVLSIVGWVQFIFSLVTWKKLSGSLFSIYSIFLSFAYLFTFGQCLMWAFGIHMSDEIGKVRLYTLSIPSECAIIRTQLVTLMGLLAFHTGAVFFYKDQKQNIKSNDNRSIVSFKRRNLYQVCKITSIVSTPLMFYSIVRNILINRIYGYGAALYNADVVATQNNIIMLLRMMYIPSIFGLLISSAYKEKVVKICYANFAIFMLLGLFAGDRGEWLFPLCILMWMHHKYYRKININKFIKFAVYGVLLIVLAVAVRNSRSSGITVSGIVDAIAGESNPIVSAIFELGGSMRPALIVIQHGWGTYPYGNSYLLALLGMVTERLIIFFQPNYISLSGWFSRSFLGISYGAGFSFIAEAIMNYGPYGSIITLLIVGIVFSKFMFSVEKADCEGAPIKAFFGLSTAYSMIQAIRNTLLIAAKTWIFSTIIIMVFYYFFSSAMSKKNSLI